MKRSATIQIFRASVAAAMLGIAASFSIFPSFVLPGLFLLLVLLFIQGKLWRLLSEAVVAEARTERKAL
jgi:hypothetical protein